MAINVQTFESVPGEAATLSALWTVRRVKDGKTQIGRTALREPTQGIGYNALAAAHSRALGRLSQDIADAIRGPRSWFVARAAPGRGNTPPPSG